jgi:Na+-translocating ferredoxin:NAD+ oxidoreductase RNF subunit RnfB
MAVSNEIIKSIYELLPKLNCGFCGFGICGKFTGIENVKTRKPNAGRGG